jgi:hypothetical protein
MDNHKRSQLEPPPMTIRSSLAACIEIKGRMQCMHAIRRNQWISFTSAVFNIQLGAGNESEELRYEVAFQSQGTSKRSPNQKASAHAMLLVYQVVC